MMHECHLIFPEGSNMKAFCFCFGLLIMNGYTYTRLLIFYKPKHIYPFKVYGQMVTSRGFRYVTESGYMEISKKITKLINSRKNDTRGDRESL